MGTKNRRIYGKGAPFKGAPQRFGGGSCPKPPSGSTTLWKATEGSANWGDRPHTQEVKRESFNHQGIFLVSLPGRVYANCLEKDVPKYSKLTKTGGYRFHSWQQHYKTKFSLSSKFSQSVHRGC